jgi:hypothetical protein
MNSIRITVKPIPSITTEVARDVRVRALRYALDRYFEKQKAVKTGGGEKGSGEARAPSKRDKDLRQ